MLASCVCRTLELLGSGAFGKVYKGSWILPNSRSEQGEDARGEVVAIKTMEEETSEEDRVKFLQEAAIMGQFNHPNIIRLLGIIKTNQPVRKGSNLSPYSNNWALPSWEVKARKTSTIINLFRELKCSKCVR